MLRIKKRSGNEVIHGVSPVGPDGSLDGGKLWKG